MAKIAKRSTRKRRRRVKVAPEERDRRRRQKKLKSDIRAVFTNAGFVHLHSHDVELTVDGQRSEFDGVFAYDNILVVTEDTILISPNDHLRKKMDFYEHVLDNRTEAALAEMQSKLPLFAKYLKDHAEYDIAEYRLMFVYCSTASIDEALRKKHIATCSFMDNAALQYFLRLTRAIHKTARFELFKFLSLDATDVGHQSSSASAIKHDALLLHEVPSGFPKGHKLVSFLASPSILLEQSYVFRADSWRDETALYQRLLSKPKITRMREYLVGSKRVFVNNIIVSLPHDTVLTDHAGKALKAETTRDMSPVLVHIPHKYNAIGIIDGQHRVFAYHEGNDQNEAKIAVLRVKQHLLVTGIIYPEPMTARKKREFEAKLFLEINDKQTRVKPDLRQAIQLVVEPFAAVAIAKAVVDRLAATGPLSGLLSVHFFDSGKIKTASIVAYGLPIILRPTNTSQSLFRHWHGTGKGGFATKQNRDALDAYVDYAAGEINKLISGFRIANLETWTQDRKKSRVLTTTTINGLIFCLRRILEGNQLGTPQQYATAFTRAKIDFSPKNFKYKSSHWKRLGDDLYEQCFA